LHALVCDFARVPKSTDEATPTGAPIAVLARFSAIMPGFLAAGCGGIVEVVEDGGAKKHCRRVFHPPPPETREFHLAMWNGAALQEQVWTRFSTFAGSLLLLLFFVSRF
jgi:hypothetical protein